MWTTNGGRARGGGRGRPRSVAAVVSTLVLLACGDAAGETHELLWSARLASPDIHSITIEAVNRSGSGPPEVILAVESRTGGSSVECRSVRTGELLWRRLPGSAAGSTVFSRATTWPGLDGPLCVAAAGSALTVLNDEGQVVASARLPGLLRSAAASAGMASVCSGRPGRGFADSLVFFRRVRTGSIATSSASAGAAGADAAVWDRGWSRALEDHDESFDNGFSRPVFGDVDDDERLELLVIERMNELVCRDDAGSERWRVGLGEKSRLKPVGVASADPVVADVTGDGVPDVVVGCFAGAVVVVDGELGEEIARLQFGAEAHEAHLRTRRLSGFIRDALATTGEPIGEMLAVDLDGVGGDELVFGCSDGFVYAVSPRAGENVWRFSPERDVYDRPVVEPVSQRRLVLWDEECLYVLDPATGKELTRMPHACITAAAVTGWNEGSVDVVIVDGLAGKVGAWRVPTGE